MSSSLYGEHKTVPPAYKASLAEAREREYAVRRAHDAAIHSVRERLYVARRILRDYGPEESMERTQRLLEQEMRNRDQQKEHAVRMLWREWEDVWERDC